MGIELSERYQFLRYYIPGFLFLSYMFGLITVNIDRSVFELFKTLGLDPISLVAVAVAISPAIGYIIYAFYDWTLYRRLSKCKTQRITLKIIDEWAKTEKYPKKAETLDFTRKKELIDFALYCSRKDTGFEISKQIAETIRGFWSHVAARYVSSIFVPLACACFFGILLVLNYSSVLNLPFKEYVDNQNLPLILLIIALSICMGYPARRTVGEAFALEEYVVRVREQAVREYMKLEKKQRSETEDKPNCVRLGEEFKKK